MIMLLLYTDILLFFLPNALSAGIGGQRTS